MKELARANKIYLARVGSRAYGTNRPDSDEDLAGIFIPPLEFYFGIDSFDTLDQKNSKIGGKDEGWQSLRKYIKLASQCNPNVIEVLFVEEEDVLFANKWGWRLREFRHMFLNQHAKKTYVSYANDQLGRMKGHARWMHHEDVAVERLRELLWEGRISWSWVRETFGEHVHRRVLGLTPGEGCSPAPDDLVPEVFNEYLTDKALKKLLPPDPKEARFWATKKRWDPEQRAVIPVPVFLEQEFKKAQGLHDQYLTWVKERNPVRQLLEEKHGYDTKFAAHTLRLLASGYEILTTGNLTVRRPEAPLLREVIAGKFTLEQVMGMAAVWLDKIESAKPIVPASADRDAINKFVLELTKDYFSIQTL